MPSFCEAKAKLLLAMMLAGCGHASAPISLSECSAVLVEKPKLACRLLTLLKSRGLNQFGDLSQRCANNHVWILSQLAKASCLSRFHSERLSTPRTQPVAEMLSTAMLFAMAVAAFQVTQFGQRRVISGADFRTGAGLQFRTPTGKINA